MNGQRPQGTGEPPREGPAGDNSRQGQAAPQLAPFVRGYLRRDHDAVYEVCVRTGDAGNDATGKFTHAELIPDIWAGPYTELEPKLAFVLDDGGTAVGYVIGTADTAAFVRSYRQHWIPHLADVYVEPSGPTDVEEALIALAFQPERMMETDLERYPAHLHIDLLPPYQGAGHGRRLIERFLESAAQAGAAGVHVVVARANTRAHGFYERVGFELMDVPGEPGGEVFYGRRLGPPQENLRTRRSSSGVTTGKDHFERASSPSAFPWPGHSGGTTTIEPRAAGARAVSPLRPAAPPTGSLPGHRPRPPGTSSMTSVCPRPRPLRPRCQARCKQPTPVSSWRRRGRRLW